MPVKRRADTMSDVAYRIFIEQVFSTKGTMRISSVQKTAALSDHAI
jgi:hypothetical protein